MINHLLIQIIKLTIKVISNLWLKESFLENLIVKFKLSNQLKNESSPYLQQHANNPVDWYPWKKRG